MLTDITQYTRRESSTCDVTKQCHSIGWLYLAQWYLNRTYNEDMMENGWRVFIILDTGWSIAGLEQKQHHPRKVPYIQKSIRHYQYA